MREFFDQLLLDGESGIDRLITDGAQETLELDFKRKENLQSVELSTNDRRILSEALSGFANSAGGVLIIGVDARPGTDGIDCAQRAMPVANIARFQADVNAEVGALVQPRIDGVEVRSIASQRQEGSGYLLLFIPRSERRPHRSAARGQKGYYKRHGSSFYEMEHYDLEDAFRRISSPELRMVISGGGFSLNYGVRKQAVAIKLQNISDYIAMYPFIVIDSVVNLTLSPREYDSHGLHTTQEHARIIVRAGADRVIHPGLDLTMAVYTFDTQRVGSDWQVNNRWADDVEISFGHTYGCSGSSAKSDMFRISASALITPP